MHVHPARWVSPAMNVVKRIGGDVQTVRSPEGAAAVAALWARESARLLGGLRALRLLGCHEADEAKLVSLAHRCPQLTALDLSGCAQLSADALPALAEKLADLEGRLRAK